MRAKIRSGDKAATAATAPRLPRSPSGQSKPRKSFCARGIGKVYFGRYLPEYRGTYNQLDGPINVTPGVFDRFDPSVPHYGGPSAS
jgi:hypothetical protein